MKELKTFDFKSSTRSYYDWEKILDGGIYELIEGQDYHCSYNTMNTLARSRGKIRGKSVRVAKNADNTGCVIQAFDASPEQIARWEKARATKTTVETTEETVEAPKTVQQAAKPAAAKPKAAAPAKSR